MVFLSSLASNGLVSQPANVLPTVYGFTDAAPAVLVGATGLLNIATLAGHVMARSSSLSGHRSGMLGRPVLDEA